MKTNCAWIRFDEIIYCLHWQLLSPSSQMSERRPFVQGPTWFGWDVNGFEQNVNNFHGTSNRPHNVFINQVKKIPLYASNLNWFLLLRFWSLVWNINSCKSIHESEQNIERITLYLRVVTLLVVQLYYACHHSTAWITTQFFLLEYITVQCGYHSPSIFIRAVRIVSAS